LRIPTAAAATKLPNRVSICMYVYLCLSFYFIKKKLLCKYIFHKYNDIHFVVLCGNTN
jgi:hypothetical protein